MSSRRSIIPPSASLSSFSTISEEDEYQPKQQEQPKQSIILQIANSTTFKRRLSRQSSLSWGHKPSNWIGASCFLFVLPIPLLLRACCPLSACLLGLVTISSYCSDHVYTGLESWSHLVDRILAPMAFTSCCISTYTTSGLWWMLLSALPMKCHILANVASKKGNYDQFVLWHSLWHLVGVGTILVCFTIYYDTVGSCWNGEDLLFFS